MRRRRRLGQHFLRDPNIVRKIVDAIAPEPGDRLVEIGPGRGAITRALLQRTGEIHVIELDRSLLPELQRRCAGAGVLHVHEGDALRFDLCTLASEAQPLRVAGNLPYNISTPLLFHLLDHAGCIADIHVMLQREVVARMAAVPGSKVYGRLTVMLAAKCRVEPLFRIGAGAFSPPPRVESAFVRLTPHAHPPFSLTDERAFAQVVQRAFSMRRKTLRNALKPLLSAEEIAAEKLDPGARPETLTAGQFAALSNRLAARSRAASLAERPG